MKLLCFYLPQFHPIPENDEWWGPGFTEWTNVARARPRFRGHYQPHIPADLGFYDLRLPETRRAQAELAQEYGIGGFCYYHYWFNGRRLLERPFDEVLESGEPDFPFCLCWANGNWTRRWDGRESEILLAQDYTEYDPAEHVAWLADAFADPRYIRVGDRPLFLVYNPEAIPDLTGVVRAWRNEAAARGEPRLYLCAVRSPGAALPYAEAMRVGFDAMLEFSPSGRNPLATIPDGGAIKRGLRFVRRAVGRARTELLAPFRSRLYIHRYSDYVDAALQADPVGERTFPCVMPSWDNSARRPSGAAVVQNDDPSLYRRWLEHAIRRVSSRPPDEQIVFINAWNEWAEGCHLEPDLRFGRRFLEATCDALRSAAPDAPPAAKPNTPYAKPVG